MPKIKHVPTEQELYMKLCAQCSLTEYAPSDIKKKVIRHGLDAAASDRITDKLIDNGYISEQRYLKAFVHDKFILSRWGRHKIAAALAAKGIRGGEVQDALEEINDKEYQETLLELLQSQNKHIKADTHRDRLNKLLRYAVSRGFEADLAYSCIEQIFHDSEY